MSDMNHNSKINSNSRRKSVRTTIFSLDSPDNRGRVVGARATRRVVQVKRDRASREPFQISHRRVETIAETRSTTSEQVQLQSLLSQTPCPIIILSSSRFKRSIEQNPTSNVSSNA